MRPTVDAAWLQSGSGTGHEIRGLSQFFALGSLVLPVAQYTQSSP